MSGWHFVVKSLFHHRRINVAVALGVAAATAVLTGALLVGDSVRGSLRALTLDRLGRVEAALVSEHFFRRELADELAGTPAIKERFDTVAPVILLPHGTLEAATAGRSTRAAGVTVVGTEKSFWQLGTHTPPRMPGPEQIVLNEPLANDLRVQVGDRVVLRIEKVQGVSGDSPLGRKTERVTSLADLEVVDIVPARGLGRFALRPSQHGPRNAYVALATLQAALERDGRCNALLVGGSSSFTAQPQAPAADEPAEGRRLRLGGKRGGRPPTADELRPLSAALRPTLADVGLSLRRVRRTFTPPKSDSEEVITDYFQLTSDRLVMDATAEAVGLRAFRDLGVQPVFTYLANLIGKPDEAGTPQAGSISYSTVTAVDSGPSFALVDAAGQPLGPLGDDELVLNQWSADDQQLRIGDRVAVTYFEPESTHGTSQEKTHSFVLKGLVPLTEPARPYVRKKPPVYDERPTPFNDPDLTPVVEGVTDQESISKWDAPFPVDYRRVRKADDDYWLNHRTTPKAFVSLAAGRKLWGSRFGQTTALRLPARDGLDEESLGRRFLEQAARDGETLGLDFLAVKSDSLAASAGATPFDVLFLALSFFVIVAALLLVSLLFRLGVEQRAAELGLLLAAGLRRKQVARLFVAEGVVVAALGAAAGVGLGVAYARLMIWGLTTWWVGAIGVPFLVLFVAPTSLLLGYGLGVAACVATIAFSVRQTRRVAVRRLLSGQASDDADVVPRPVTWSRRTVVALVLAALALAAAGTRLGGEAQAGAFVGAGVSILSGLLLGVWSRFRSGRAAGRSAVTSLPRLAARNVGRNPTRSTISIGLMATASFLIVAMSSFRLDPTAAGTGGFDLIAESSQPLFANLNDATKRRELLAEDASRLEGGAVLACRLKAGDDASCTNLYQARQPRVLGVTPEFVKYFETPPSDLESEISDLKSPISNLKSPPGASLPAFSFAASAAKTPEERANPWRLLQGPLDGDVVPAILDKNTAMYSLKMYGGIGEERDFTYDDGTRLRIRVVGLLANSVLQGSLLIGESAFTRKFPSVSGHRFFLVRAPTADLGELSEALENRLGDEGFDAVPARRVLRELLDVQNTYLSTFQSLGALGLLLGTFGLATVQMRSVLERRSELALLRAAGFGRGRLARLVLLENVVLLLGGLATGVVSALLAVLPHVVLGDASLPVSQAADLAVMLSLVLAAGLVASLFAVRATLRAPLLAALRGA